jgi:hypothetical protein
LRQEVSETLGPKLPRRVKSGRGACLPVACILIAQARTVQLLWFKTLALCSRDLLPPYARDKQMHDKEVKVRVREEQL